METRKKSDSQMVLREKRNCESQDGNFEGFKAHGA